eukprot:SAG22_NODE_1395_length_4511_cov_3.492747_1_plen_372_part_00
MPRLSALAASALLAGAATVAAQKGGGPMNAGQYISKLTCGLDPKVNASSWQSFRNEILGLWQPFCAINRGIFVTTPGDGNTYSCGNLPASWGFKNIGQLVDQTPEVGLHALDQYISAVFNSSDVIGPDTCDFHGLAKLTCNATTPGVEPLVRDKPWKAAPWVGLLHTRGVPDPAPLRAVNIGGLFVLEPWITPTIAPWSETVRDQYTLSQTGAAAAKIFDLHWNSWYNESDFSDMASYGLNAIRLPVGWWYWAADAGLSPDPYYVPSMPTTDPTHPITKVIKMASDAKLMVIIDLHGAPSSQNGLDNSGQRSVDPEIENWGDTWLYNETAKKDTTAVLVAITDWINKLNTAGLTNVIMLELVNEPWVFGDM